MSKVTAENALQMLLSGNKRFSNGKLEHPRQDAARRMAVAPKQAPFAIVLTCSDSRVPPEILFDAGLGDLFVIRNAGNILDDTVLGSIEYAAEHLDVGLLMVLGHTQCGAITAAVQSSSAPAHIGSIVQTLQAAVAAGRGMAGDPVLNAAIANVRQNIEHLRNSEPVLADLVRHSRLVVVGAIYHVDSGVVEQI